jgi:hypothetical protein
MTQMKEKVYSGLTNIFKNLLKYQEINKHIFECDLFAYNKKHLVTILLSDYKFIGEKVGSKNLQIRQKEKMISIDYFWHFIYS